MLVLTRKTGESVFIGDDITVTVSGIDRHGNVRIGIDAPRSIEVRRDNMKKDKQGNSLGNQK